MNGRAGNKHPTHFAPRPPANDQRHVGGIPEKTPAFEPRNRGIAGRDIDGAQHAAGPSEVLLWGDRS